MATIHIIGAGLSGLAAAVKSVAHGQHCRIYEAAPHSGGRCRSWFDAELDRTIDNGMHLLLQANSFAREFLNFTGGESAMSWLPGRYPFVDAATKKTWQLNARLGLLSLATCPAIPGALPFQLARDARKLLNCHAEQTVAEVLNPRAATFQRFWEPLILALLNTPPAEASATLLRDTLRELIKSPIHGLQPGLATTSLDAAFVTPALHYLAEHGCVPTFRSPLQAILKQNGNVHSLQFREEAIALEPRDSVILATPREVAKSLLPELALPEVAYQTILNLHYAVEQTSNTPSMTGILNGTAQWAFHRGNVLSITISAANHLAETDDTTIAHNTWQNARMAYPSLPESMPAWRLIREKRATPVQSPAFVIRLPGSFIPYPNFFLAGDYTATGLPCTIEGAIKSGFLAASCALHTAGLSNTSTFPTTS